jgi:hypothetical protein
MMGKYEDDWGLAFGSDKDKYTPPAPKKQKRKDTTASLVYEFRDQLMMDTSNLMNAQVNGPAMMKAFRKILDTGRTYDDIRAMIAQFHKDIQIKPLTDGIPAWKAFLGRLDTLANKVERSETNYVYDDDPKIDPRLMKDNNG